MNVTYRIDKDILYIAAKDELMLPMRLKQKKDFQY